jgi:hypothetical protein
MTTDIQECINNLNDIRRQVAGLRPTMCCNHVLVTAGGVTTSACSNDCHWQALDLNIANALVYAEAASHRVSQDIDKGLSPHCLRNNHNWSTITVGHKQVCVRFGCLASK